MIVSNAEIARVLELVRIQSGDGPQPVNPYAGDQPSQVGLSPPVRVFLISSLREMLAAGVYEIPPELVAEKIIGRAICDQVRYLCERATIAG
jgi:hypothetical protein